LFRLAPRFVHAAAPASIQRTNNPSPMHAAAPMRRGTFFDLDRLTVCPHRFVSADMMYGVLGACADYQLAFRSSKCVSPQGQGTVSHAGK